MIINYDLLLDKVDTTGQFYYNKITINHDGIAELKVFYNGLYIQDPNKEQVKRNDNENIKRSIRRTRSMVRKYASNNRFDYFVTFTFARNEDGFYYYKGEKYDITKTKVVYELLKTFYRKVNTQARRKGFLRMKYLFVLEKHKSGHLHIHGLIMDIPDEYVVDSGKYDKGGREIKNIIGWDHGFTTALKIVRNDPEDSHRIASYLTQYMTEDLARTYTKGERRYYASIGLKKPLELYDIGRDDLLALGLEDLYENDYYKDNEDYKVFNLVFNKEKVQKVLTSE